ncbi:MAG: hypothetical protein AB7E49_09835 [Campylobacterales bacterium]
MAVESIMATPQRETPLYNRSKATDAGFENLLAAWMGFKSEAVQEPQSETNSTHLRPYNELAGNLLNTRA